MSKTPKKLAIVSAVVLVALIAATVGFKMRYDKMSRNVIEEYGKITAVNLSKIPDGVYEGSFKDFLVNVKLAVVIKKGRIADVKIKEQFAGPGYEAADMPSRIVKAQSPKVDAITGATGSSMGIMIATHRAIESAKPPK
ncbi:MAG: FMN-binding protein [Endomicrobiia bacterium]|nr:FMN-binding protein [Endomicrobiia bacterium]